MHSFKTAAVAVFALLVGAQAQEQYSIDPNSVDLATREKWCESQKASCPLLCLQLPGASSTTDANTCDPTVLTYQCICGNGLSPNATEYSQTLPFYICQEWGQQCVANCGSNNNDCQAACTQDHPCGAQNPTRANTTSTATAAATAAATGTGTGTDAGGSAATPSVYNGFGSGGSAATTTPAAGDSPASTSAPATSDAQDALSVGRSYGVMVVVAGLFTGFALVI